MSINFNEISKDDPSKDQGNAPRRGEDAMDKAIRTGERTRFIAKPNPRIERSYEIFEYNIKEGKYEPAGEYLLLNKEEARDITDKKIINIISMLNEKEEYADLSNLTKTRSLYSVVPEAQAGDQTKIIFKDYDGSGVSKDNAVLTIKKGVLYDKYSQR